MREGIYAVLQKQKRIKKEIYQSELLKFWPDFGSKKALVKDVS